MELSAAIEVEERENSGPGLEYREDQTPRCEQCGDRMAREDLSYDASGHLLCKSCSARGLVRVINDEQRREGLYRICPSCREPTMLPQDAEAVSDKLALRGDVSYDCVKCGRTVTFSSPRSLLIVASAAVMATVYASEVFGHGIAIAVAFVAAITFRVGYEAYKYLRFVKGR